MLASTGSEIIRRLEAEARQASIRRFWWRYARPEPQPDPIMMVSDAEVIELVFGPHCEAEEYLGA